jgi:hypothetical protein
VSVEITQKVMQMPIVISRRFGDVTIECEMVGRGIAEELIILKHQMEVKIL